MHDANITYLTELRQLHRKHRQECDDFGEDNCLSDDVDSIDSTCQDHNHQLLQVVPRVVFEAKVNSQSDLEQVTNILVDASLAHGFDGYTLELFDQFQFGLHLMK